MDSISIRRTDSKNKEFVALIKFLDAELAISDGEDHAFYDQFNQLDNISHVVVAYAGGVAVGCGAFKSLTGQTVEVKRMFTTRNARGKGVALKVLFELEQWARELLNDTCVLETGIRQTAAISLYTKAGYVLIPNYGQYEGVNDSLCFQKDL